MYPVPASGKRPDFHLESNNKSQKFTDDWPFYEFNQRVAQVLIISYAAHDLIRIHWIFIQIYSFAR